MQPLLILSKINIFKSNVGITYFLDNLTKLNFLQSFPRVSSFWQVIRKILFFNYKKRKEKEIGSKAKFLDVKSSLSKKAGWKTEKVFFSEKCTLLNNFHLYFLGIVKSYGKKMHIELQNENVFNCILLMRKIYPTLHRFLFFNQLIFKKVKKNIFISNYICNLVW